MPENEPPVDWPQQGAVRFESYVTRYRPELPPCIKGITLDIRPGEKIGVCGRYVCCLDDRASCADAMLTSYHSTARRTGAGKSSLTLALLRVIEASEGSITIDGVDISTIGLHDLRSRISIIPQDPQLFEGDLRQNIDPVGDYTDDAIWEALTHSHLRPYAEANGGLDGKVAEGGQNLSSGQRQLLCFARALLFVLRLASGLCFGPTADNIPTLCYSVAAASQRSCCSTRRRQLSISRRTPPSRRFSKAPTSRRRR